MDIATQSDICAICGDKSSGVHYGAVSCYGCKGFFYRAVTDNRDFECKLNRRCLVTKDLRCGCRYCRFQKCLHVGMKREAITEKKGAAPSKKLRKEETPKIELSIIERLIEIENRMNEEIKSRYSTWKEGRDKDKVDNDVESLRELSRISLDMLIEWAKTIWPFMELSLEDQCHLLRNYAAQHLILLTAHSESNFNFEAIEKERNLLGDMFVTMQNDEIACRVLDELVYPFRKMQFLNEEYLCFKTFIFLCPDAKYLKEEARKLIQEARTKILGALFSFMTRKHPKDQLCNQIAVRYGRIILLGQAVQRVTQHICQNMKMIRFFGLIELDEALADFIVDLPIEDEKPDEEITECYADNDDLPCCSTSKQINTKTYFEGFDRARIQRIEEELEADGVIENVISQMWEEEDYDVEEESASGYL